MSDSEHNTGLRRGFVTVSQLAAMVGDERRAREELRRAGGRFEYLPIGSGPDDCEMVRTLRTGKAGYA